MGLRFPIASKLKIRGFFGRVRKSPIASALQIKLFSGLRRNHRQRPARHGLRGRRRITLPGMRTTQFQVFCRFFCQIQIFSFQSFNVKADSNVTHFPGYLPSR